MHLRAVFLFLLCTCSLAGADLGDTARARAHLLAITKTTEFRSHDNIEQLDKIAAYIEGVFRRYCDTVYLQEYAVNGKVYRNVIGAFGTKNSKRIVVGAHYDVCGDQQGADDNASGVVGLLELARLMHGNRLSHRIDLVAYTLEEPPYFRTEYMGSHIHARSLSDSGAPLEGMVSLEMIGYFKDEKGSQTYPAKILSLFYGKKGDYITLVRKYGAGKFARKFCRKFKSTRSIKTKKFTAPTWLPGIDFSDHLNYWMYNYSALMITDTSFYRNKNYHTPGDTLETLDLYRMCKVIDGVYKTLLKF